jgi:hypothetical protein
MPKFTKRHYTVIAEVFNLKDHQTPLFDAAERLRLARTLARVFALDNPRFDRERFLFACGVPDDATEDGQS